MFAFEHQTVYEHEAGIRYDDGRLTSVLGPGRYRINRKRTAITRLDLREQLIHVQGQEITLKDGLSPRITWSGRYKVSDPKAYVTSSESPYTQVYYDLQMAIREVIEGLDYEDLMVQRSTLGEAILRQAGGTAGRLGITLLDGRIRDISLPGELKKALAEEKKSQILAKASLEKARTESATLRSLANSARMLEERPALMQLRLIHALEQGKGSLVLNSFPGPIVPVQEGRRPDQPDEEVM